MTPRAVVLAAALLASCTSAPSPPPSPQPDGTLTYEGRVLSDLAETVTVELRPLSSSDRAPLRADVAPGATFRIAAVPRGDYTLTALSPSSAMLTLNGLRLERDVRGVELHVRPACRIVGHVTFGPGVDPQDCTVEWTRGARTWYLGRIAGEDGAFRVDRVEPGEAVVTARWTGRDTGDGAPPPSMTSSVGVRLVPGDNAVEIALDPRAPLGR